MLPCQPWQQRFVDEHMIGLRWPTTVTSKAKRSRQKQNARVKSKIMASKAKRSRQKQNSRVKSKTVASKAKCIRALVAIDEQKHSENLLIVKLLLRH